MRIEKLKNNNVDEILPAFLEGILMPNGEFVYCGKSIWLKNKHNIYVAKIKNE